MSTRANIIIKDSYTKQIFYRHSDGYPEGIMPALNVFRDWLLTNQIRNNVSQSSGWLVMIGAIEYNTIPKFKCDKPHYEGGKAYGNVDTIDQLKDWKVGAFEPTDQIHGDIEYLYIIDLENKSIACYDKWTKTGKGIHVVDITAHLTGNNLLNA